MERSNYVVLQVKSVRSLQFRIKHRDYITWNWQVLKGSTVFMTSWHFTFLLRPLKAMWTIYTAWVQVLSDVRYLVYMCLYSSGLANHSWPKPSPISPLASPKATGLAWPTEHGWPQLVPMAVEPDTEVQHIPCFFFFLTCKQGLKKKSSCLNPLQIRHDAVP